MKEPSESSLREETPSRPRSLLATATRAGRGLALSVSLPDYRRAEQEYVEHRITPYLEGRELEGSWWGEVRDFDRDAAARESLRE
ncbi:MAG: hypothetical protein HY720_01710 [Planctomycetes bacterium]|nr:hypothetical protein [Planctomycetota bacterium]